MTTKFDQFLVSDSFPKAPRRLPCRAAAEAWRRGRFVTAAWNEAGGDPAALHQTSGGGAGEQMMDLEKLWWSYPLVI